MKTRPVALDMPKMSLKAQSLNNEPGALGTDEK
jgi:hypothetical protein